MSRRQISPSQEVERRADRYALTQSGNDAAGERRARSGATAYRYPFLTARRGTARRQRPTTTNPPRLGYFWAWQGPGHARTRNLARRVRQWDRDAGRQRPRDAGTHRNSDGSGHID